ncbi:RagB/SusD family nutrient uptake outer membrane protein [Salegentibacter sp. F188]|uniref:RagB/SusD family nutrient uptake outer membrane protein n=1 Tax=Autumnicola patrickiae TaxID=3075591 RepID=A0ABU3E181_9FLAO|nr:RagB/SusD family nutrient uptake outer membrane protein [Salegentibacter sp. F188]MDT0689718.1 RagB/SusD family nutrient uptake outer membrane protein [Salegentibacter sp. F188]
MKRLNIYFLLFLGLLSTVSCSEDFLDAEPITETTDANFYRTPEDAFSALAGCYDGLQIASGGVAGLSYPVTSMVLSDNMFGGVGNADPFNFQAVDEFDINRAPTYGNLYETLWIEYYRALYRCNVLINKMDQIDWSDDPELRGQYESEARFIRAYLYFQMVKLWGNIPLLTEPSSENIPQADPDEVYTVIAEDLMFGSENLPVESYNAVPSGRVTRWAAKSMLARVYLYYTGYYNQSDLVGMVSQADALSHLEDVINSSGHGLLEDYARLWPAASVDDFAGENNEEIVFSVKHTYTSDYDGNTDGNHWMVMLGMREFTHYPYAQGWGITVNPKLYNAYDEDDTRRDASIIAIDEEEIPFDKIENQREYTGYYTKKYTPLATEDGGSLAVELGGTDFQIGQFQDFYVMRYADVLLMAAELGSPNAQSYFDAVRQRAYQDDFSSQSVTLERIQHERWLEFALEGIRYWDLLRRGVSEAAQVIAEDTTLLNGGIETPKVISASNIQETEGLQQIPNNQITLSNGVLIQNTGW